MLDLSRLLGVAGGLALIYTGLAVGISGGAEWLAAAMQWRSKNLYKGLRSMLLEAKAADGTPVVDKLFGHPVIQGMSKDPNLLKFLSPRLPSYIPGDLFAKVLPQLLMSADRDRSAALTVDDLRRLVDDLDNPQLKEALLTVLSGRFDSIEDALKAIEGWYDMTMERVSGWYARRMWSVTFAIGLVTALALGVDTIAIAERLWNDPEYRQRMNQMAADQLGTLRKTIEASPDPAVSASADRLFPATSSPSGAGARPPGAGQPEAKGAAVAPAPKAATVAPSAPIAPPAGTPTTIPPVTPGGATTKAAPVTPAPATASGAPGDASKSTGSGPLGAPAKAADTAASPPGRQEGDKPDIVKVKLDALRARVAPFDLEGMKDLKVPIEEAIGRRIDEITQAARKADLPLGHDLGGIPYRDTILLLKPILGFLLTALAVSMGAKFWFDILSNLVNVRIAGKRPDSDPGSNVT